MNDRVHTSRRCAARAQLSRWAALAIGAGALILTSACSTSHIPTNQEPIHLALTFMQANAITTIYVGSQMVPAGVDTGGGGITLSEDAIKNAGGTKLDRYSTGPDAFGREIRSPMYRVPAVTIGGHSFHDMVVTQSENLPAGAGPPVPNSIGRQLLSQYFVQIDYPKSTITLWPIESNTVARASCGAKSIPMERTTDPGLVVITLTTSAGPVRALLDTGASYSVLPETLVKERGLATNSQGDTSFYRLGRLVSGGHDLGSIEFVVLPAQPPEDFQAFLGFNFFNNRVVCLDYGHREVLVQ